MYRHERVNVFIGWALAALALVVYLMTTAPVVAFWDNGEFIAVGYTLGVGHPPGSPVYTLLSRLFSLLPFNNVARAVNFESIVAAALAMAFLYFSVARMARRWEGKVESFADGLPTYVAGVTCCLLTAFSFSFWENALEAEVYATNILTMTLTLWLVLKWTEIRDVPRDRRLLYLVIYLLALGVGTHLGCLLWAPAFLLFVVLFERNLVGVLFLALPLGMGFVLLSKGIVRGAAGIWILWLAVHALLRRPGVLAEQGAAEAEGAGTSGAPGRAPRRVDRHAHRDRGRGARHDRGRLRRRRRGVVRSLRGRLRRVDPPVRPPPSRRGHRPARDTSAAWSSSSRPSRPSRSRSTRTSSSGRA